MPPPAGFEPTITASERPQIHALDRAATGISVGAYTYIHLYMYIVLCYTYTRAVQIHSFFCLSYDKSVASSKASSPQSAI
jgi:hypothetical protein